ncbi:MFS transporter [Pseudofulvimonas gallinarii]|uniref:1-acyl-sn-glycerol-3-phosphate acyltransferase n=1 Tax=Pseudofulvimonas gallinarii TaxID=634155 RepID=A0A4S3KSD9_9GAMM|nr:MFS transporter [Pseudofulvimonas gallinarii]TCT00677.1 1-acyl-sn-glycerol-3-phosphate acyltransferase [Pseudofulvimonas gallinarii]THD12037.1 glycerol acyltransferase [Pseudofulvimonas gallinarii]
MSNQFSLLRSRRFLPFFLTQALGAFNDNVFRNALVILIAFRVTGLDAADVDFYSNLAAGLFILPFFLLSATAGQWAERSEKSRAIRQIKLLEIGIMVLAAFALWTGSLPFLMAVLCLSGAQSALFGPVKYSILPQALRPEELVGGNGLIEASTFLAILIGSLFGGWLMNAFDNGECYVAVAVLVLAIAGWLSARAIPVAAATDPSLRMDWNPVRQTWRVVMGLRGHRAVLNAVLGISWFWFFGSVVLAQLPNYTKVYLGGDASVAPLVLTLFAFGIGLGSLMCEMLSRRTVEIGLVPLGALGLTVFGVDLYLARPEAALVAGLDWRAFLAVDGNIRLCIDLLLIGLSGGFFIVPLFALVQQRAPRERLSQVIAANNILNALFMVAAAVLAIVLLQAGLNIPELLLVTAVLNALVAIYIFTLVPEFVARFVSWLAIKALYRIDIQGLEHIPDEGPALVVCNHVSYMDALLLMGAVPRPIRFVMYYRIFNIPGMKQLFKAARAIPIAGSKEDPDVMERAFAQIDAALAAGELVGIFPEGGLTTDGEIAPFKRGVERILATRPVPVVPMALRGMWASMWSRRDSRLHRARLPRRFRARIGIIAGPPIAPEQASAASLEAAVRALRGDRA